ncbi:MAG: DUF2130 domain-containing protein [Sphaerochaetaceae bacterium]|nr:DUF2130 domain-containing protein [Sphaerochaetaceae bacterium]
MNELKCPNCGQYFTIDETGYSHLIQQVRDSEFNKSLEERVSQIKKNAEMEKSVALSEVRLASKEAAEKALKDLENSLESTKGELEKLRLQSQVEKTNYEAKIKSLQEDNNKDIELAVIKAVKEKDDLISAKDKQLLVLKGDFDNQKIANDERLRTIKEGFEMQLKMKDDLIGQLKDFKLKQSTKMVGESLEQYCSNEFNKIRATAFPNAYFEKDNDSSSGSKGDFIYKEEDGEGNEIISIMFEMKNEMEDTVVKHHNSEFFKKLDKDRNEKKCEYAILVTMLESDNELYNSGIVDVSYAYNKMYVIRPQFFIPIITVLRNAALKAMSLKRELVEAKNASIDITNFETNLNDFKTKFDNNYRMASERFEKAVHEIDATIDHLNKVKENLIASERNLRLANDKAESLTIKRLVKDNPTMKERFEQINVKI